MGINLDLFLFQLSDLEVSRWLLSGGIEGLKRADALTGFIVASSGIPGPPEEEALEPKARKAARTERRLREMLSRMTYVFACTCLEDLLQQCVRAVFLAQPKRVLGLGDWWRDGNLVQKQVIEGWSRDRVVDELVEAAVRNYLKQPFPEVPKYFQKWLDVPWKSEWRDDLVAVVRKRNKAAHEIRFEVPDIQELAADIKAVMLHGEAIARAVATMHNIPLKCDEIDEIRYGSTGADSDDRV